MLRINRDRSTCLITALCILAALVILLFSAEDYVIWIAAPLLALAAAVTSAVLKKRSIHSYYKQQVLLIVAVFAVLYLTLYYLSGLEYGFVISQKGRLTLYSFITSVLPITVIIVATEIIREIQLAQPVWATVPISYLTGVLSELIIIGGIPSIRTSYQLADFVCMTLFPALTANLAFTYLTKRYGKAPSLAYRLIMTLYVYFIPAISDLPRALPAFILLILPIIMYAFIDMLFEKKRKSARKKEGKGGIVFSAVAIALMLCFVLLITCQFRFGIVVIATDSMTGEINRGDAVVYESYEHVDGIKENDVIIFEENNKQVVHRVVQINTVDGQRQYITKGDANEGIDSGYRTDDEIVGVVRLKVLYIGYPSLWLRQIINK